MCPKKGKYISSVREREKSLFGSGDGRLFNSQNSKEQIFNLFVWLLQSPYSRHANGINPCGKSLRKIKVKNLTFNTEKPFMLAIFGCCRHYYVRSVSDTTLSLFFSLRHEKKKKLSIFLMCRKDFMFIVHDVPLSHFGLYLDYIRDILSLPLKQTNKKRRRRKDTRFNLSRWIFLSTPKYSNPISLILLSG